MTLINNVVYVDGMRSSSPTLEETFETLRDTGGVAWISLYRPDESELRALAAEFSLHPLAMEDAVSAHQRSKIERYAETTFLVLRPAQVVAGRVVVGELHLFIGPNYVISVRHTDFPDLASVRRRMEAQPKELGMGPTAILYAILDQVVDDYAPVVRHLMDAIDDAEDALYSTDPAVPKRLHALIRDVILMQRAVHPADEFLAELREHHTDNPAEEHLQAHLRDVHDHVLRVCGQVDAFRDILASGLQLHIALVGQRQNEEVAKMTEAALQQTEQSKKVSAWAAILFTPTVIAGIYGMNFAHMPELNWLLGYPFAVGIMLVAAVTLYLVFKRQRWL